MKAYQYKNSLFATLAYLIIIITGLKVGSDIIVPFLMAFFWFILFLPLVNKFRLWGVPDFLSSIIVLTFTLIILTVIGTFLVSSGQDLIANLPSYQEKYHELLPKVTAFFEGFGISLGKSQIINLFDPIKIIDYAALFFKNMGGVMTDGFLTLLIVLFLFLESSLISKKILYLLPKEESQKRITLFLNNINTYFIIKTIMSGMTGLLVWGLLAYFKLDYALLFGLLAFFLNYIPSIGSMIAALPALLLALIQLPLLDIAFIAIGYIIINNLIGNFIEPKITGKGVGLSAFIVFISMIVWGWILGPVGMFLSIPLTIVIKIACDNNEEWQWVSVLLSDDIK